MPTEKLRLDKAEFFRRYCFTAEEFERTGIDWSVLEQICVLHTANVQELLQTTADYISQRLRQVPDVHSLKMRIKHPEHLIAKIVRKKLNDLALEVTSDNYHTVITDLIGIRALHLFKDQWRPIHEFVMDTWELEESPIAYVRDGDPDNLLQSFRECGCKVEEHGFGYRSVHYLIKSQPARRVQVAELQVRTLFEEGWSEIDHQVRYPRVTDNPHLAEFLTIFNRLAGSADEMGTFIQALSRYVTQQTEKLAEKEAELKTKEQELKKAISELKISEKEKSTLETQVDELRQSSQPPTSFPFLSVGKSSSLFPGLSSIAGSSSSVWSPGIVVGGLQERTCSKCRKVFKDDSVFGSNDKCPECRKSWFLGG